MGEGVGVKFLVVQWIPDWLVGFCLHFCQIVILVCEHFYLTKFFWLESVCSESNPVHLDFCCFLGFVLTQKWRFDR